MYGISKIKRYMGYILPLIILIIGNGIIISEEYSVYKDETIRMGRILEEKPINELTWEEAENILQKYGYINGKQSSLYKKFIELSVTFIFLSIVLDMVIIISLKHQEKELSKKYSKIFTAIERNLEALKDGEYSVSKSALKDVIDGETDYVTSRIDTLMESLDNNISIIKETAEADKRETKAIVTDISHQLKIPLTAIKSTFEIIQNEKFSIEERKEMEMLMGFQISSLEKLILSLIHISKLESGMINIKLIEDNLFDLILEAVNSVWLKADEKNISIEFDNCEEKLPNIMCDRKWLVEAFINILDNSVKYSEENTKIFIDVKKLNLMVRIEIKDQGIGITDKEKHKVFQRFYRGHNSNVSKISGSGVGLYLARYIISQHNGTIMVKDNRIEGKKIGSIFIVHLPIKESLTNL